jgi:thiamine biosynthesis lipoprotein
MRRPLQNHHETEAHRRARNLAALIDLGFECAEEPLTTESVAVGGGLWRVSQSMPAMGTVVMVSVLDEAADRAAETLAAAFAEMQRAIGLLNRFDAGSALGVLNAEARLRAAPDELLEVLHQARAIHLLSTGAFDITVAPVIDLFRDHREAGLPGLPDADALRTTSQRVNASGVVISGRDVQLRDGVELTLDGIAKGYVVDCIAAVLARRQLAGYLVNGGGDIRTGGTRDGASPWRVGVRDPEEPDAELDVLPLTDGAVATSGSYEIYFDRERTRHHIVSATGTSPGECQSVTVRAATTMLADALATAAFVAGPAAGTRLVESVPGCSCLVVDAHGKQHPSSSWLPGSTHGGAQ